jgi:hypothetical protein
MSANTTGASNTAVGKSALQTNTTSNNNTAVGDNALSSTTGAGNTAVGVGAGTSITSGANNTIIGGFQGNQNGLDIRTSSGNIVLSDGNGYPRLRISSDPYLIVQAVYDTTTSSATNVRVGASGVIQRSTSSLRYKDDVKDSSHGLTDLLKLRSVTFKGKDDSTKVIGGLIAEEVHDAGMTEFVDYDDQDRPDALAYGNMVSLCIKAIQELKTELDAAKTRIATLEAK